MSEQAVATIPTIKIKPTEDRIVVLADKPKVEDEVTKGGVIIPAVVQNARQAAKNRGTVVAVGPGRYSEGQLLPMLLRVGDAVCFSAFAGEPYPEDGEDYKILRQGDILGTF